MITAYCIHQSEGIPVRRIVETRLMVDTTPDRLEVTATDCDWDWNKKGKATVFTIPLPKKTWNRNSQQVYHHRFRSLMFQQYNWRFEVYHPLSSIDD